MKKITGCSLFICSAIAAFCTLALAGCDLELRGDGLGDTGKRMTLKIHELTEVKDNMAPSYAGVTTEGTKLVFDDGVVSSDTGIAFSFCITDAVTSDWTDVLTTTSTITRLATMDYTPNGVYECNIFEGASETGDGVNENGAGNPEGGNLWDTFTRKACFVTIDFSKDGSISYYKDGLLVIGGTNASHKFNDGSHTIEKQVSALIKDLTNGGTVTTGILMKNITVTEAINADTDKAELLYKNLRADKGAVE